MRIETAAILRRWRLLGLTTAALLALTAAILIARPDVDGVRCLIRTTARISLLLFCLAFTAAATSRRWPGVFTRWQRSNRRYLGLSFAVSHGIHALAIVAFACLDPLLFNATTSMLTRISGGIAYVLIVAMSATSFDRSAAWIGTRRWRILHVTGAYYIWASFFVAFAKRAVHDTAYWLPVIVVISALLIRLLGGRSKSSAAPATLFAKQGIA